MRRARAPGLGAGGASARCCVPPTRTRCHPALPRPAPPRAPTGIATLTSMVVSRLIFQHLGWGVAAAVTPAVMGAAGAVFFCATLLGGGALGGLLPEQATAAMVGAGAVAGIVTQVGPFGGRAGPDRRSSAGRGEGVQHESINAMSAHHILGLLQVPRVGLFAQ
jgi:hypothetical protein